VVLAATKTGRQLPTNWCPGAVKARPMTTLVAGLRHSVEARVLLVLLISFLGWHQGLGHGGYLLT
jgi:hypothetical protein